MVCGEDFLDPLVIGVHFSPLSNMYHLIPGLEYNLLD